MEIDEGWEMEYVKVLVNEDLKNPHTPREEKRRLFFLDKIKKNEKWPQD